MTDIKVFNVEDYVKDKKIIKRSVKTYILSLPGLSQLHSGYLYLKRKFDVYKYGRDSQLQKLEEEKALAKSSIEKYENIINRHEAKKARIEEERDADLQKIDAELQSEKDKGLDKKDPEYFGLATSWKESEKDVVSRTADERIAPIDKQIGIEAAAQADAIERYRYLTGIEDAIADKRDTKEIVVNESLSNTDENISNEEIDSISKKIMSAAEEIVSNEDLHNQGTNTPSSEYEFYFGKTKEEQQAQGKGEVPEGIRKLKENHQKRVKGLLEELGELILSGDTDIITACMDHTESVVENMETAHRTEIEGIEGKYNREIDGLRAELEQANARVDKLERDLKISNDSLKNERDKSEKQAEKIRKQENTIKNSEETIAGQADEISDLKKKNDKLNGILTIYHDQHKAMQEALANSGMVNEGFSTISESLGENARVKRHSLSNSTGERIM